MKIWKKTIMERQHLKGINLNRKNMKNDNSAEEKSEKGSGRKSDITVNRSDIAVNRSDIVVNRAQIRTRGVLGRFSYIPGCAR